MQTLRRAGRRARPLPRARAVRRRAAAARRAPRGSASTRRFDQRRRWSGGKPLGGLAVHDSAVAAEDDRAEAKAGEDYAARPLGGLRVAVLREKPQVPADLLPEERRRLTAPRRAADVDDLGLR